MTDAEISKRLALAIGWPSASFYKWYPYVRIIVEDESGWRRFFDYRDPAVIWPIAERFKCFPDWLSALDDDADDEWAAWDSKHECFVYADTAAKAVALAVIKAKEQK